MYERGLTAAFASRIVSSASSSDFLDCPTLSSAFTTDCFVVVICMEVTVRSVWIDARKCSVRPCKWG